MFLLYWYLIIFLVCIKGKEKNKKNIKNKLFFLRYVVLLTNTKLNFLSDK